MGLFWDLMQQSQISTQRQRAESIEERVARLEDENRRMQGLLRDLIARLEERFGEDIDGDGRVG